MTRRRMIRGVAAATVLLVATSAAQANNFFPESGFPASLTGEFTLDDRGRTGSQNATLVGNNVNPAFTSVQTRGFKVRETGTSDEFLAWCLDTLRLLNLGATGTKYKVNNADPFQTGPVLSAAQRGDIKELFDLAYDEVLGNLSANSGGFQLALWEIVNENNTDATYNILNGGFKATAGATTVAAGFLSRVVRGAGFGAGPVGNNGKGYNVFFLETTTAGSAGGQNLVTVSPVPLPAAGLMLLTALGGVAAAYRRKQRKAV